MGDRDTFLSVRRVSGGDEFGQVSRPGVLSRRVCHGFDGGERRRTGGVDPDMVADLHMNLFLVFSVVSQFCTISGVYDMI